MESGNNKGGSDMFDSPKRRMAMAILSLLDEGIAYGNNPEEQCAVLGKAAEWFCSSWDLARGFEHAIRLTLDDQLQNHPNDLSLEDLHRLKALIMGEDL